MAANSKVYVIQPQKSYSYGLGALVIEVLKYTQYADANGMIPYIDWGARRTQYSNNELDNAWNYYFTQPLSREDCINNLCFSSEEHLSVFEDDTRIKKVFSSKNKMTAQNLFDRYYGFSDEVKTLVASIPFQGEDTVGLLLRGTDYVKLKPSGHAIQPTFEEVVQVVDSYVNQKNIKLFVVTEDYEIIEKINNRYGDIMIRTSSDKYITDYAENTFLAYDEKSLKQLGDTPKERGMQYLCKLILLSKCDSLIAGDTCGSWFSYVISNSIKNIHVFNYGIY